jgi:S1-C subfamily serine protease
MPEVASDEHVERSFPGLAKAFSKGVVQIEVSAVEHQWVSPQKPPKTEEWAGSGWFIHNKWLGPKIADSDALHLVTNGHVAIDAVRIVLRLPQLGKLPIPAEVIGLSPPDQFDLALLRVKNMTQLIEAYERKVGKYDPETSFVKLDIGNSDDVHAGENLMALGYPEGLPGVKTTLGVLSGYQQMGSKLYMQMTTPINPGNSGGPLLNKEGYVVGVNTAGIPGSENIGFAIPADNLKAVLPVLVYTRRYVRPMYGISIVPTSELNELFGMPKNQHGLYIAQVFKDSLAEAAGIQKGDVLFEIDGMALSRRGQMWMKDINTYVDIEGYMQFQHLNSKVGLKVWRMDGNKNKGAVKQLTLTYKITKPTAIPTVYEAALKKLPFQIKGGLVFSQLTQNYVSAMTNPVVQGGSAYVAAPNLMKYGTAPYNNEEPKVVIADVATSSLGEETKVFQPAMVVKNVNGMKVNTMAELCEAFAKPAKDVDGEDWITVETVHGEFSGMPLAKAEASDRMLAKTGMYKLTSCSKTAASKKKL